MYGDPLVSVVTFGSLDFDIFALYSAMTERGWSLNALQFPSRYGFMSPWEDDSKFYEDLSLIALCVQSTL